MVKRRNSRKKRRPSIKKGVTKYESKIEEDFGCYWKHNIPIPITPQHKFHHTREWRFDFAFPQVLLAVEIQGFGSGHTSYTGMHKDYEKHNAAIDMGWDIYYLMSVDLTAVTIRKTCKRIEKQIILRSNSLIFLQYIKEMSNAIGEGQTGRLPEGNRGCNDHLTTLRSKLHKRFD